MGIQYNQRKNPLTPTITPNVPQQVANKLGSGLKAPLQLSNGRFETISGVDKVKQAVYMVLSTPVGSRLFQPDFGSMLPYLVFKGYNQLLKRELLLYTETSLKTWVPQITISSVFIDESDLNNHIVNIIITYTIKGTNSKQVVSIPLAMSDQTQLKANVFTIGGRPLF